MSQDPHTPIEQAIANLKAKGPLAPLVVPKAGPIKMESPIKQAARQRKEKRKLGKGKTRYST